MALQRVNVVNFVFPVLEDGRAQSASGNYVFTILKITESYDKLLASLQDVCDKVKDIEVISPGGKVYHMTWLLRGDWKFLATVCGLESAMSNYPCIWCKCPKDKRSDMTLQWSINNSAKGARNIFNKQVSYLDCLLKSVVTCI